MKNFLDSKFFAYAKKALSFLSIAISVCFGIPVAFGIVTRANIPYEINNFYDNVLLTRALPFNLHGLFGQGRAIPSKTGTNTIKFRRYESLLPATTPLTEGVPPAGSSLTTTEITATVFQYGDFVTISDVVDTTIVDPILTETSELLGEQMGLTNDRLTRDILIAGTTVQYANDAVSRVTVDSTDLMSVEEVKRAVRTLGLNNARPITSISGVNVGQGTVPIQAAYISIVHPRTAYTVKSLTGFISVEKYSVNTTILPNEIGTLDMVRYVQTTEAGVFVQTTEAGVFTGAGAGGIDVYGTLVIGANAYGVIDLGNSQSQGIIYKELGSAGTKDALNQEQSLGWKEFFTAKILNDAFMVRIEHAVA